MVIGHDVKYLCCEEFLSPANQYFYIPYVFILIYQSTIISIGHNLLLSDFIMVMTHGLWCNNILLMTF